MRTDNELIKEFQEGREAAFNELVDRYLSSTYGFFTKFTDSKEEAEDLAQEIFIKMYISMEKISQYICTRFICARVNSIKICLEL